MHAMHSNLHFTSEKSLSTTCHLGHTYARWRSSVVMSMQPCMQKTAGCGWVSSRRKHVLHWQCFRPGRSDLQAQLSLHRCLHTRESLGLGDAYAKGSKGHHGMP